MTTRNREKGAVPTSLALGLCKRRASLLELAAQLRDLLVGFFPSCHEVFQCILS